MPIRVAYLDSSALVAYYVNEQPAKRHLASFLGRRSSEFQFYISPIAIAEVLNQIKKIPNHRRAVFTFLSNMPRTYRLLQLPDSTLQQEEFFTEVRNMADEWARNSPTDALLAQTMWNHLRHLTGTATAILVTTDQRFGRAMRSRGFLVFNPQLETFENFLRAHPTLNDPIDDSWYRSQR